jgi:hypothetical protein
MQRAVGLSQTERTTSYIGTLAAGFPEAADKLNVDEAIDDYADRAGSPPKIIRSDDDVAQIQAVPPASAAGAGNGRVDARGSRWGRRRQAAC